MSELISIIVPIYKVEEYLRRCVDSILKQTYKNLEIILVNDGSPDGCGAICDEYAALDGRIKVIHKTNGGLSDARNAGIQVAHGSYVSFVDSDDWIHQEYIRELYYLLRETNSDISICNFIETSSENIELEITTCEIFEFTNHEALEHLTDTKFCVQMVITCGKLYKRNMFDEIRFPVGRIHEDEFTTHQLLYKASKIVMTSLQLYYYWQRDDSITGSGYNVKYKLDAIDALTERAEFFKRIGLDVLSHKTYRNVFFFYLSVNRRINDLENKGYKYKFNYEFTKLKEKLRRSNQSTVFKMFYELYYIFPRTINTVFRIYEKFRRREML